MSSDACENEMRQSTEPLQFRQEETQTITSALETSGSSNDSLTDVNNDTKLSQDTGYASNTSAILIADVSLPQFHFDCEEFEHIVSTTPLTPRGQELEQNYDEVDHESSFTASVLASGCIPMRQSGKRKRRERKQKHAPRIKDAVDESCEFMEMTFPITPDTEKKKKRKDRSKARRNLSLSEFDMNEVCAPYEVLCTNSSNNQEAQMDTPDHEHHFDLAYPGIAPSQRTPKKIESRRISIKDKMLRQCRDLQFTLEEEYDIHDRAETFIMSIMPDPTYYQHPVPGEKQELAEDNENINPNPPPVADDLYHRQQYLMSPFKRRRRRNYSSVPCLYVKRKACDMRSEPYDNSHVLPEGTKLMKPPNKLVELVAQTLDESPDGLLQVQQVYTALMNKYPYFRFMDRTSINSWRSSIRHALYQKWFRKVKFNNDLINSKGCFWAINRKHTPREWTMPGQPLPISTPKVETSMAMKRLPFSLRQPAQVDENMSAVHSILCGNQQGPINLSAQNSQANFYESFGSYCGVGYPRCSDPVLSNTAEMHYSQPQEHATDYSTKSQTIKSEPHEKAQPVASWDQHGVDNNGMYVGPWAPSWEEYHQSLAYQPPLLAASYYMPQANSVYVDGMHYAEAMPYYYHHSAEHGYSYAEHW